MQTKGSGIIQIRIDQITCLGISMNDQFLISSKRLLHRMDWGAVTLL
ncbi:hypothetical protein P4V43_18500 [Brevibacillus fortis]|nr:hypothetical protein [Brevibacillus fortis]